LKRVLRRLPGAIDDHNGTQSIRWNNTPTKQSIISNIKTYETH
jgi:hypothetical protein